MEAIEFRCVNCGRREEKEVLAIGHAIKGYGRKITEGSNCCKNPHYIDSKGYCRVPRRSSLVKKNNFNKSIVLF